MPTCQKLEVTGRNCKWAGVCETLGEESWELEFQNRGLYAPGWHQLTGGPQASRLHLWASVSPPGTRKGRAGTFLRSLPAPTGHDQLHNKLVAEKPCRFHAWSFSKTEASSGKRGGVSIPCRAEQGDERGRPEGKPSRQPLPPPVLTGAPTSPGLEAAAKASPHLCPIFLLACRTPRGMEGSGTRNGVSSALCHPNNNSRGINSSLSPLTTERALWSSFGGLLASITSRELVKLQHSRHGIQDSRSRLGPRNSHSNKLPQKIRM